MGRRIVALIDMDCFYVQVEQRERPELWGKPTVVVQYNEWKKGGIIAVSYEARERSVKRQMRGEEALKLCPELNIVQVPCQRGKADLTKYRQASQEVFNILATYDVVLERSSIDEAYLDLTNFVDQQLRDYRSNGKQLQLSDFGDTHLAIVPSNASNECEMEKVLKEANEHLTRQLENDSQDEILEILIGAMLVFKIRRKILDTTKFKASAGVAWNKMLAKLVCGMNKPNKQTVLLPGMLEELYSKTPIRQVRMLGGKFGAMLTERFELETMQQLVQKVNLQELRNSIGDKADWVYGLCQGVDNDPVTERRLPKSIGCSKNFPEGLKSCAQIKRWVNHLCEELEDRLKVDREDNERVAKLLTLIINTTAAGPQRSRSCHLDCYEAKRMARDVFMMVSTAGEQSGDAWHPAVTMISISASRFEEIIDVPPITNYFKQSEKDEQPCSSSVVAQEKANDKDDLDYQAYALELRTLIRSHLSPKLAEEQLSPAVSGSSGESIVPCTLPTDIPTTTEPTVSVQWLDPARSEYFPHDFQQVDDDVWKALPPEMRWELKHELKLQRRSDSPEAVVQQQPDKRKKSKRSKRDLNVNQCGDLTSIFKRSDSLEKR